MEEQAEVNMEVDKILYQMEGELVWGLKQPPPISSSHTDTLPSHVQGEPA